MIRWIRQTPRWVVELVAVYVVVLVFVGATSHIAELVRSGLHRYSWAPDWLNLYWSSLAVFDSLAALLLVGGRKAGCAIPVAHCRRDVEAGIGAGVERPPRLQFSSGSSWTTI
ncbi:hypothetical protein [Streptomyces sp. NPDC059649]|uniref:hypothetical protein n=1 Tax=Streptomyces sp. NPDC059649 TaxID=3346895 RepID=UPI003695F1CB